jgi:hypothetical protein
MVNLLSRVTVWRSEVLSPARPQPLVNLWPLPPMNFKSLSLLEKGVNLTLFKSVQQSTVTQVPTAIGKQNLQES